MPSKFILLHTLVGPIIHLLLTEVSTVEALFTDSAPLDGIILGIAYSTSLLAIAFYYWEKATEREFKERFGTE